MALKDPAGDSGPKESDPAPGKRTQPASPLVRDTGAESSGNGLEATPFEALTFDQFARGDTADFEEAAGFDQLWLQALRKSRTATWGAVHQDGNGPEAILYREDRDAYLKVVNFAGYDYLGLGRHPEVIQAAHEALDHYGLGSGGSPITCGTLKVHKELEGALAGFLQARDAGVTLFPTGFAANVGTISALFHEQHLVIMDQFAHASIQEGARLSGARILYFRHNDPEHLEGLLSRYSKSFPRVLVAVESVYSAQGDFSPLAELLSVARRFGARFLVDEAHSMLVAGPGGRGLCAAAGIIDEVDFLVMTFSKGFGGIGGAVLTRPYLSRYINWYAGSRMFSCSLDPAATGGILKALELGSGETGDVERARLQANAARLREQLSDGFPEARDSSWIIPVIYGNEQLTPALSDAIQCAGLTGGFLQYPAVPRGHARIRLFTTSRHRDEHMERAVEILKQAGRRFGFYQA